MCDALIKSRDWWSVLNEREDRKVSSGGRAVVVNRGAKWPSLCPPHLYYLPEITRNGHRLKYINSSLF